MTFLSTKTNWVLLLRLRKVDSLLVRIAHYTIWQFLSPLGSPINVHDALQLHGLQLSSQNSELKLIEKKTFYQKSYKSMTTLVHLKTFCMFYEFFKNQLVWKIHMLFQMAFMFTYWTLNYVIYSLDELIEYVISNVLFVSMQNHKVGIYVVSCLHELIEYVYSSFLCVSLHNHRASTYVVSFLHELIQTVLWIKTFW